MGGRAIVDANILEGSMTNTSIGDSDGVTLGLGVMDGSGERDGTDECDGVVVGDGDTSTVSAVSR